MKCGNDLIFGIVGGLVIVGAAGAQSVVGDLAGLADSVRANSAVGVLGDGPIDGSFSDPGALTLDLTGTLTQGQNLAFAVLNGDVRFQAPTAGDLPLGVTGALVVGGPDGAASFRLEGSFASPTRSYIFDVFVNGLSDGLTVTPNTVVVSDQFDDFDFDLVINRQTGRGSFSYSETVLAGGVELTRVAVGTIGSAVVVPSPAVGSVALAGAGLLLRRRR